MRFIIISLERPPKEILAAVKVKDRRVKLFKQGGSEHKRGADTKEKGKGKEKERGREEKKQVPEKVTKDIKHVKPILVNKYATLRLSNPLHPHNPI